MSDNEQDSSSRETAPSPSRKWSDTKAWVMAIIGAILVAAIIGTWKELRERDKAMWDHNLAIIEQGRGGAGSKVSSRRLIEALNQLDLSTAEELKRMKESLIEFVESSKIIGGDPNWDLEETDELRNKVNALKKAIRKRAS